VDKNGDGEINKEEFEAMMGKLVEQVKIKK
jgi:EF hand